MRIWKFANKLLNKNPTIQEESSASASLPEQKYVDRDLGENEKWIKEKFIQCDDVKIQKMEFSGDPTLSESITRMGSIRCTCKF